jgi:hypothetical protein
MMLDPPNALPAAGGPLSALSRWFTVSVPF